jgi:Ca-activated chloride channel family protein
MLSFSDPQYLWFLFIIPLLVLLEYYIARKKRSDMERSIHPATLSRLYPEDRRSLSGLKKVFLLLAVLMLILTSGGLRLGAGLKELRREGMDVIVALDLSLSMDAADISPSRLERSKYEVKRLISQLQGDRIGLVGFAGVAHLQCPITSDYRSASMLLEMMDTGLLPVQGTAFSEAIYTAVNAFPDEDQAHRAIILISDGEDHEQQIESAAQKAAEMGIVIYTLGVGTIKGAPIPVYDRQGNIEDYLRDSAGRVVTTTLQEHTLRQIAQITDGRYYRVGADRNPIESIYEHILHGERREYQTHEFARYTELYLIFAIFALIFLMLAVLLPESICRNK